MDNKTGIVFLHGAGLGSFIWSELQDLLQRPSVLVNFPRREQAESAKLSFADYLNGAIHQVKASELTQFVIVAHSISGGLGLLLKEDLGDRVKGFVAISAVIPRPGKSFVQSFPFPQNVVMPLILRLFGTKPPEKSIRESLCNDLEVPTGDRIVQRLTAESRALYTTGISYQRLPTPSLYLRLTNDKALPLSLQDRMAKVLGAQKTIELATGHLPMLSQPRQLADAISSFVEELDGA